MRRISEEAPTNSVGSGAIAGANGDPPGPSSLSKRLLKRKELEQGQLNEIFGLRRMFDKLTAKPLHFQDGLNPKIWNGDTLKSDVLSFLRRIATDFIGYAEIPKQFILDVQFQGSLAGRGWHDGSDIDLHIILKRLPGHLAQGNMAQKIRTAYHKIKGITLYGYPVELFVEEGEIHANDGIFSIMRNRWIKKPRAVEPNVDERKVQALFQSWYHDLDTSYRKGLKHSEEGVKAAWEKNNVLS